MSEHITQAKQARETLARALGALQSDPTVPPALMDVAEPVAQAMGALHGIERSGSLATAPEARDHVRAALGKLQAQSALNHPAVNNAMESVAGSLGLIFGLVRAYDAQVTSPGTSIPGLGGQPGGAAPVAAAPAQGYAPAPAQAPAPAAPASAGGAAYAPTAAQGHAAAPQGYGAPASAQGYGAPAQGYAPAATAPAATAQPAPAAQPAQPGFQPAAAYQAHDAPAPTAFAPAAAPAPAAPAPAAAPAQVAPQLAAAADPFAPVRPASVSGKAPPSPAATPRFEAALGISSATNFYKGLSGNDVIEHGGLFVATYNKVPPVGSPVSLRVILPGGFEFESMATVVWTRDSAGGGGDQPGFGARFTQINAEAKQLVYRYVRNREPLFYDDL